AHSECVPRSPPTRSCTACTTPAPTEPLQPLPVATALPLLSVRLTASALSALRPPCASSFSPFCAPLSCFRFVPLVSLASFALSPNRSAITARHPRFPTTRCNSWYVPCYFRRCTICLSVRLLCRVFLPSVGNAHGVC